MIRGYMDDDYEKLKALYMHREWYGGVFDEARDGRVRLTKKIMDDPEAILVYEQGGELHGSISIVEDGRVAWLYRFVVQAMDPEITIKLYEAAASVLKSRGHKEVLVYSDAASEPLDERYEALGMKKGGTYTSFWRTL